MVPKRLETNRSHKNNSNNKNKIKTYKVSPLRCLLFLLGMPHDLFNSKKDPIS